MKYKRSKLYLRHKRIHFLSGCYSSQLTSFQNDNSETYYKLLFNTFRNNYLHVHTQNHCILKISIFSRKAKILNPAKQVLASHAYSITPPPLKLKPMSLVSQLVSPQTCFLASGFCLSCLAVSSKFRQAGPDTFWLLPNLEASRPKGEMLKNTFQTAAGRPAGWIN